MCVYIAEGMHPRSTRAHADVAAGVRKESPKRNMDNLQQLMYEREGIYGNAGARRSVEERG